MPSRPTKFSVRPGRADDLDQLCTLEATSFSGDRLNRARMKHWLTASNGTLLTAQENSCLLGYGLVIYRRDSRAGRVYSITVDPVARGRGVARRLMAAMESDARCRGRREMRLEVASRNAPAISLYQRLGYSVFGRRPGYYEDGDTALQMKKSLSVAI